MTACWVTVESDLGVFPCSLKVSGPRVRKSGDKQLVLTGSGR